VHEPSSRPEIEAEVCKAEYRWRTIAPSVTSCVNQFWHRRPFPSCFPWASEPPHPAAETHCPETTPLPGAAAEGATLPRGPEPQRCFTRASWCPECRDGTHESIPSPSAPCAPSCCSGAWPDPSPPGTPSHSVPQDPEPFLTPGTLRFLGHHLTMGVWPDPWDPI